MFLTLAAIAALIEPSVVGPYPAQCSYNDSAPIECQAAMLSEEGDPNLYVVFTSDAGLVVYAGPAVSDSVLQVKAVKVNETALPAESGTCTIQARSVTCTAFAGNTTLKVRANFGATSYSSN